MYPINLRLWFRITNVKSKTKSETLPLLQWFRKDHPYLPPSSFPVYFRTVAPLQIPHLHILNRTGGTEIAPKKIVMSAPQSSVLDVHVDMPLSRLGIPYRYYYVNALCDQ